MPATSTFVTPQDTPQQQPPVAASPTKVSSLPGDTINDAHKYLCKGFSVDDDTQQNEDNIGPLPSNSTGPSYTGWGWDGIDFHKEGNHQRSKPMFTYDQKRPVDKDNLLMTLFINFIPFDFITGVIIPETNKNLTTPMSIGEFLTFIGLWLIMSTTQGCKQDEFWSSSPVSIFCGAPFRLNG